MTRATKRSQSTRSEAAASLRELDWMMLATVVLCCLGLVMAVSIQGARPEVGAVAAMKSHGIKLLVALVGFLFAALLPVHVIRRLAMPAFLAATVCCLMPLVIGESVNGAHRWIRLSGFQFQPVEPARFFMIPAIAWILAQAGRRAESLRRGFLPAVGCAALLAAALFCQPDNGNAMIVMMLAGVLGLLAGVRLRVFLPLVAVVLPLLVLIISQHSYVRGRLESFGATEPGSQVGLGLIALAAGGLFGSGLGNGWMKFHVPEAHNDFVFTIVGEELGFLGSMLVLTAFATIGFVGYRLTTQMRDPFLRYVVAGYTLLLCVQAAANLLVVSGLAPAKGIDLPFVSAGGTSLTFCLAAVGLIGNAARSDRRGEFSTVIESAAAAAAAKATVSPGRV